MIDAKKVRFFKYALPLLSVLAALLVGEGGLRLRASREPAFRRVPPYSGPSPALKRDPNGIWVGIPEASARVVYSYEGKLIYDASYSYDRWGRRRTGNLRTSPSDRAYLFSGCSFTFGEGVDDNKTFVARFESKSERVRSYNYGSEGGGPQDALALLRSRDLKSEVPEPDVTFLYSWMDDHFPRLLGTVDYFRYGNHFLRAKAAAGGGVELVPFPLWQKILFPILADSALLRIWPLNRSDTIGKDEMEFSVSVFLAMRDEFKKQFPQGRFGVVFLPGQHYGGYPDFEMQLKNAGIWTLHLDQNERLGGRCGQHYFCEGHPTPKYHQLVADRLWPVAESTPAATSLRTLRAP